MFVFAASPGPRVQPEAATAINGSGATLNAAVDPEGSATAFSFEYGMSETYGQNAPATPGEAGSGSTFTTVSTTVSGLKGGTLYHYRVRASNAQGTILGADRTFETLPTPQISGERASEVTATGAKLEAKINPRGSATHYHLEYDTAPYQEGEGPHGTTLPVPDRSIGAGTSFLTVSQSLSGLPAGQTYYWRVVATNANGTSTGAGHSFAFIGPTVQECPNESLRTGPSASLPACRAYELVTPAEKNGAVVGNVTGFSGVAPEISIDGSRLIAGTIQCFAGAESCAAQRGGNAAGSTYSFQRSQAGWQPTELSPPVSLTPENDTWAYGPEADSALFSGPSPPFGEDDFYYRTPGGSFVDVGPVTDPAEGAQGPHFASIHPSYTADFSHLVWTTVTGPWPSLDATSAPTGQKVYEYAGSGNSQPLLVGVTGGEGSRSLVSVCGTSVSFAETAVRGALSADGRTVFFTASPCGGGSGANAGVPVPVPELFARVDNEAADARTVAISRPTPSECGAGSLPAEEECRAASPGVATFYGASADGSAAVFADPQQLTPAASEDPNPSDDSGTGKGAGEPPCTETVGPNGCNLYLYDFTRAQGHHLIAVSAGDTSGEGPRVQGVMALSEDGSRIYYVAKGVLATNANQAGAHASSGAENLYLFRRDADHPEGFNTYIATLTRFDRSEFASESTGIPARAANLTPDGRYLVFTSAARLTADDTSQSAARQVFRYDAATGSLQRISIGIRGFNDNGNRSAATPCGSRLCAEDARIASAVQRGRPDPTMSDDGRRIFFESPIALTPGALEDVQVATNSEQEIPEYAENIYEWQAEGTETNGKVTCAQAAGCISLISDGKDTALNSSFGSPGLCLSSAVCLWGTDPRGENVFFTTSDSLVGQDIETGLDVYDARIDGGFPPPAESEPCGSLSDCHGAPGSPSSSGAAGTNSFGGPEEGPHHPRHHKKGRRHHKKHRHRKGHGNHRHSSNRRAGRHNGGAR